mmetsp:Transcript_9399/g.19818  ORF Transcript_9399/g.19818 Transcript_9399/m.19818 type:complete len:85 (+) Transcript_9399:2199-2453(+)
MLRMVGQKQTTQFCRISETDLLFLWPPPTPPTWLQLDDVTVSAAVPQKGDIESLVGDDLCCLLNDENENADGLWLPFKLLEAPT